MKKNFLKKKQTFKTQKYFRNSAYNWKKGYGVFDFIDILLQSTFLHHKKAFDDFFCEIASVCKPCLSFIDESSHIRMRCANLAIFSDLTLAVNLTSIRTRLPGLSVK